MLKQILNDVLMHSEPLQITKDKGEVILVSHDVLNVMTETRLRLLITGMLQTLVGLKEDAADTAKILD